ncbi:MAG: septum formation initiator family protein [Candidatus Levybacteria bacterium]|nr:septum formation initiator family protein [Candidatus Levybacteria bacterium]
MKKIVFVITIIVCLIIINNLVRSIYSIWQKEDLAISAQKELDYQKELNIKLKSQLSYVQTQEFIEREARNKLFMTKPNESIVIVSKEEKESENPSDNKRENKPNWKKWLELFF